MVLGSISARDVEDVDTKPKAAKNLLIQPLEKKNIGEQIMQMIIQQLMSMQMIIDDKNYIYFVIDVDVVFVIDDHPNYIYFGTLLST